MEDFTIATEPILWVRLVALAGLCSKLVDSEGPQLGLVPEPFDGSNLLHASLDPFLAQNHDRYCEMLRDVASAVVASSGSRA